MAALLLVFDGMVGAMEYVVVLFVNYIHCLKMMDIRV
jgi:hypothetical protein